jgi:GT2 family glycosyltransferase
VPRSSVSIVIPTWNGRRLLEEFLPSVIEAAAEYASTTDAATEIVIVDDGSTDETLGWLADQSAESPVPLRIVRHEQNQGFGAACNTGVREARHPLIFLLNNDVDVLPNAIEPLVARFNIGDRPPFAVHCRVLDFATGREEGTGKVGGFARGFLRVHRSYVTEPRPAMSEADRPSRMEPRNPHEPYFSVFASGGSSMLDRDLFLSLGGFDPLFAPFYMEDVELSYRAWKRGLTVEYEPRSTVKHRFSSTIGPAAGATVPRVGQRNRLIFHWMHLHDRRFLASHVVWVAVLLLAAPLTFKPHFIGAFFDASKRRARIRARRQEEKLAATRSDREVLQIFSDLIKRRDIRAYDDPDELADERRRT